MKIHGNKRKGVFVMDSLFFCIFALTICVFSWDVSRLMYYKVYNQNLSSIFAISVVNESGYYMQDSTGEQTKGYLVTSHNAINGVPKGFSGSYADDPNFLQIAMKSRNQPNSDCEIVDINLNDNYTDYDRFVTGSDGVNGEAKVKTTLKIKMFLPEVATFFGSACPDYVKIANISSAIPLFTSTGDKTSIDWNSFDGLPQNSGYSEEYYKGYEIQ